MMNSSRHLCQLIVLWCLFSASVSIILTSEDCGLVGDGQTLNTKNLQECIDHLESVGGGKIFVLEGKYVIGSVFLASNIHLHVEAGATLLGSEDHTHYPWIYSRCEGKMKLGQAGLLNGGRCEDLSLPRIFGKGDACKSWKKLFNATISGSGTIDGRGQKWWDGAHPNTRPNLLSLFWVDGLTVTGLALMNSPFWTLHPVFCSNVFISGLNITAPPSSHNTDGIDPDSCQNVYISNCTMDSGDDPVAIKSGRDADGRAVGIPTENVLVEDCVFLRGHGVAIGSEMSGGIRNVTIRNCECHGTNHAVLIKASRGRGGYIEDVTYENIRVSSVSDAININMNYNGGVIVTKAGTPTMKNIVIRNITAVHVQAAGKIMCLKESPCHNIQLIDVDVEDFQDGYECEYAEGTEDDVHPHSCLQPEGYFSVTE